MKNQIIFFLILFGLITITLSEKKTTIKIVTTKEEDDENEEQTNTTNSRIGTSIQENEDDKINQKKRDNAQ